MVGAEAETEEEEEETEIIEAITKGHTQPIALKTTATTAPPQSKSKPKRIQKTS